MGIIREERHYESLAYIAAAAAVLGTATAAYATYQSGQDKEAAARYNAQVSEQEAQQARDAAKVEASNQAEAARRAQATVRARIAGSGVEMAEGSPLLVLMDNARQASIENQRILYGGEVQATGRLQNAALQRFQGSRAAAAGSLGAGVNLLSGIGSAGSEYYRPRRTSALSRSALSYEE